MPRRRSSNLSEDDHEIINDLVFKLQVLLPQLNQNQQPSSRVQASSIVLEETCSYIRKLEREVAELSGRLSQLLDSTNQDFDLDYIRTLLQL
ncbi:Transcription factor PRE4 [Linum grandiflorum]